MTTIQVARLIGTAALMTQVLTAQADEWRGTPRAWLAKRWAPSLAVV